MKIQNTHITGAKQNGFTMIELGVTLVIMAILAAGMYSIVGGKVDDAQAQSYAQEIAQSAMNLKNRHATQPPAVRYQGIDVSSAESALTQTLSQSIDTGQVLLDWGVTIDISSSNNMGAAGNTNQKWDINGLPEAQCRTMIALLADSFATVLNSSNNVIKARATNDRLEPSEIDSACSSDSNDIAAVM